MKKTTGNNLRLGLFVTVTVILFIVGIYYIGDRQQLFSHTFHVSGVFKNIDGLQVGSNVRYSGINVGVVGSIQQTTDSSVRVDMLINEGTRKFIKTDACAIIGSDGLMGNKIISLIPGISSAKTICNHDEVKTIRPISMDDIMLKVKTTADNAADISADLAVIMDNITQGKGTIGKLFMDSSFATNLDKTLINIKQGSGGFKRNMDAASHNFLLRGFLKKKHKDDK